jgi:WD40 repeat protein
MELTCGEYITEYCDNHHLSIQSRLKLFQAVCRAVQHAHQHGIIHRDLKPSNIMVIEQDGLPQPKIIDFGIAKALHGQLADQTQITQPFVRIGTLAYMSPEQVHDQSRHLDTRTDIYSLGVLLYELITGLQPFDSKTRQRPPFDKLQSETRQRDPPKPSTRLSSVGKKATEIARRRSTELPNLKKTLRGDLDRIVMKAIERERDRRYQGANELADDISRYLEHKPIEAGPPNLGYRARKFVNRHPFGVAFTLALFLTLGVGLTFSLMGYTRARSEQYRANRNLYVADMRLAYEDWKDGQIARVVALLENHIPRDSASDLRGWEWYYLLSLCHRDLNTMQAHKEPIYSLALTSDGTRLASTDLAGLIRIWDTETWSLIAELTGHLTDEPPMRVCIAWSPDDATLVSGGDDGVLRAWESATLEQRILLEGEQSVRGVTWSPDGGRIAAAGSWGEATLQEGGFVTILDAASGAQLQYMIHREGKDDLHAITWSPDGTRLASGGHHHGEMQIWDPLAGRLLQTTIAHANAFSAMAWSPDGTRLVTASYDTSIRIWDATSLEKQLEINPAHHGKVLSVAWSTDGFKIVSSGEEGLLKIWNTQSGRLIGCLRGHRGRVSSVLWNNADETLYSGGADGTIKHWNPQTAEGWQSMPGESAFAFDPEGRRLAVGADCPLHGNREITNPRSETKRMRVNIVEVPSGRQLLSFPCRTRKVRTISWHPDGKLLGVAPNQEGVRIWDLEKKEESNQSLKVSTKGIRAMAWHRDGQRIVVGGHARDVNIWNTQTGQIERVLLRHSECRFGPIFSVAWDPHGTRVAACCFVNHVMIWDANSGDLLHLFSGPQVIRGAGSHNNVAWNPMGTRLASGFGDGSIIVWDTESGEELHVFTGHTSCVASLDWSPDGDRLLSLSVDGTVRLWNASTGREMLALPNSHGGLDSPSVAWSPNGKAFAVTGSELRYFDATIGYERAAMLESNEKRSN